MTKFEIGQAIVVATGQYGGHRGRVIATYQIDDVLWADVELDGVDGLKSFSVLLLRLVR